jgi:hypothetical protein
VLPGPKHIGDPEPLTDQADPAKANGDKNYHDKQKSSTGSILQ